MRSFRVLALSLLASVLFCSVSDAGCCFGAGKAARQARRAERRVSRMEYALARQGACAAPGVAYASYTSFRSYQSYGAPVGPVTAVSGQCSGNMCPAR